MRSKMVWTTLLVAVFAAAASGCTMGPGLDEAQVEQDILPPPTSVTATATSSSRITVSWTAVTGAVKYYVYQSVGSAGPFSFKGTAVSPATQLLVANLSPSTQYCYEVRTVQNTGSVGSFSSPPACTTTLGTGAPPPPSSVTATATGSDRIQVDWSSVSGATKYAVLQSTGSAGPYAQVGTVLAPTTTFSSANLQASTQYCFEVASMNGTGTGTPSAPVCATTLVEDLAGYWAFNEGSGSTATDKSGFGRDGTLTGSASYSSDHPMMDNNRFSISSPGGTGDAVSVPDASVWWLTGDFTLSMWVKVPAAPAGTVRFAGKEVTGCGAVNWELFEDASGVQFRGATTLAFGQSVPVGTWTQLAVTQSGGTATAYINGAQASSGAFTIGPRSSDAMEFANSGNCGGDAVQVDEVRIYTRALTPSEVATLGTPPAAPTNLVATVAGSTRVNLSWDAVAGVSKYFIYKGTASGNEVFFRTVLAPTTSYSDTSNMAGSTASYVVRSVRDTLISDASNEQVVTTSPPIAAPTGVTATAIGSLRIRVDWNAVPSAVKYYVWQSANGGAYAVVGTVLASDPTTFTAANLMTGVNYCYEVQTQGSDSTSVLSSPACTTP